MGFVTVPMVRSSLLADQQNGRLDPGILRTVPASGGTVTLIHPAARSFAAMHAAAADDGITLGSNSSYRTYARQVELFTSRYTTRYLAGRPYKVWRGQRWYQKPGTPVTAIPGGSNHGWGSAVDFTNAYGTRLTWLVRNAGLYGWSWEVQSEAWHLRYFAGDRIPRSVLAYEAGQRPEPSPPEPEPVIEEDEIVIFSLTDTGSPDSNFVIMPDGPVRIEPHLVVELAGAGMKVIGMRYAVFNHLCKGPRWTSFEDDPVKE